MKRFGKVGIASAILLIVLIMIGCSSFLCFRGEMDLAGKRYEAAITKLQACLDRNPEDLSAKLNLGSAYASSGNADRAAEIFRGILKERPGNPPASLQLGLVLLGKGDRKGALEAWQTYQDPAKPILTAAVREQRALIEGIERRESSKTASADAVPAADFRDLARQAQAAVESAASRQAAVDEEYQAGLARGGGG